MSKSTHFTGQPIFTQIVRPGVTHLDLEGSENAPNTSRKQLIFNTLGLFLSGIFCNLVADNQ